MSFDITFCNPIRGCDKKESCRRWLHSPDYYNLFNSLRISVSDFSTNRMNGYKKENCEDYLSKISPNQTAEK